MRSTPHRVTIAGLLGLILILAVGFAALRSPSWLWANALFSLAMAAMTFAVLAAIECRGPARSFWRGFAICGGSYLILSCGWAGHTGLKLLTTSLLDIIYPHVSPPVAGPSWGAGSTVSIGGPGVTMTTSGGMGGIGGGLSSAGGFLPEPSRWQAWTQADRNFNSGPTIASPEAYRQVGHSVFSLILAALGGRLALFLRDRGKHADS